MSRTETGFAVKKGDRGLSLTLSTSSTVACPSTCFPPLELLPLLSVPTGAPAPGSKPSGPITGSDAERPARKASFVALVSSGNPVARGGDGARCFPLMVDWALQLLVVVF